MPFSLLLFLVTSLLGGSTGAVVKYLVEQVLPVTIALDRLIIGLALLLPFVFKNSLIKKTLRNKELLVASIFFTSNILLYAYGIQHTSLIMGQILYVPTGLVVAIISFIFLKENISREKLISLGVALAGMGILLYGSIKTSDVFTFGKPLGNVLIILAMLSWSTYTVMSRKSSKLYKPLEITFVNFLLASVISAIFLAVFYRNFNLSYLISSKASVNVWLLFASIISLLFVILYQVLIKKTSAFTSSLITYLNPVVASFLGIIFFKEHLTTSLILGGFLVTIAVFYSTSYQYLKVRNS